MDFSEQIKQFSERVSLMKDTISTEESTKMSLVVPLFQILGYDVFNPLEFCPEYTADVGIKKGEKVDYAILENGQPNILIECKSCTEQLEKHASQLFRYFSTTPAKFGILTNGIVYKFFTDLEESNKMDLVPFLVIDMCNIKDSLINELKKFCKDAYDKDKIFSTAEELKYTSLAKSVLAEIYDSPSEDFVRFFLNKIYEGQKNQKVIETKEVWLSMTIDVGDLNVKAKQAQKFLSAGNKVKVSIRMRGRQMAHSELGLEVMKKFFEIVKDYGTMEKNPLTEGRNIWMMLAPAKA